MTLLQVLEQKIMEMFARRLDYAPKTHEEALASIAVMERDLRAVGLSDADSARVAAAFDYLGPRIQKWPTTFMIRENLPKRDHFKKLPEPNVSPEQAARNIEKIRAMIKRVGTSADRQTPCDSQRESYNALTERASR